MNRSAYHRSTARLATLLPSSVQPRVISLAGGYYGVAFTVGGLTAVAALMDDGVGGWGVCVESETHTTEWLDLGFLPWAGLSAAVLAAGDASHAAFVRGDVRER